MVLATAAIAAVEKWYRQRGAKAWQLVASVHVRGICASIFPLGTSGRGLGRGWCGVARCIPSASCGVEERNWVERRYVSIRLGMAVEVWHGRARGRMICMHVAVAEAEI